jgi:hypothetical protein
MSRVIAVALLLALPAASFAQRKAEPLAEQVGKSIARGTEYLFSRQTSDGGWDDDSALAISQPGGQTALAVLALLNAGVPKDHPKIARGLANLRKFDSPKVYVRALQAMALAEANLPQDRELLRKHVRWLIDARVVKSGKLEGWAYTSKLSGSKNASTTQYAVLGLWAGHQAGVEVSREIWQDVRDYYIRSQNADGFWIYDPDFGPPGEHDRPSLTMTTAGLSGLLIAGMELNAGREEIQKDGTATNCGVYDENTPAAKGLRWLGKNFALTPANRTFYHLYGLERAGRLSGLRFIGEHDWYREGCAWLVKSQLADGSWSINGTYDKLSTVSTSFALLFLSKGRTPVLVSKLVHGQWPRQAGDLDWNNDRNDLRHLVKFAGKELYKGLPLAWQTFDLMHGLNARSDAATTEDAQADVISDLLQSPVLYITGHRSPNLRITPAERNLLRRYVENGGFILAEACCGSPQFDRGFKELVEDVWPGHELSYLDGNHPVWSSFFPVTPGQPYKLMGLSLGCKTVLVYSPQDLSCFWESGTPDKSAAHQQAFRLGANVLAYATGMQPPRPRLTETLVARDTAAPPAKRNFFEVGQLYYPGDWQPAPKAMAKVLEHVRTTVGLDVRLKPRQVRLAEDSPVGPKFLYLHGRGQFSFAPDQVKPLQFNLETGGLLLADACCGDATFDKAFRAFMTVLFPGKKLERVPPDDPLFAAELSGEKLTDANIKCRQTRKDPPRPMAPYLEGIKGTDGRWLVLYSKYDLGCALEGHQSLGCLGYDPPSALRIATAAVLYNLRP